MLKTKENLSLLQILEKYNRKKKDEPFAGQTPSKFPILPWIIIGGLLLTIFYFSYIVMRLNYINDRNNILQHETNEFKSKNFASMRTLGGLTLPAHLANIPFADANGLILDVKRILIRGVKSLYNPSLVAYKDKFLLIFRYDVPHPEAAPAPFFSFIGIAELDEQFNQTEKEFLTLDVKSNFAEDPRATWVDEKLYISFNDRQSHDPNCRAMHVAHVNPQTFSVNYITKLDLHLQHIEKNWTPFEYRDESGKADLYFEYSPSPHKIFKLPRPHQNDLQHLKIDDPSAPTFFPWATHAWGHPRGGTGAIKIGNEYLSFFHSSFKYNQHTMWYLMGAYTFEAHPPFRITGISHYPIFFNGIYATPSAIGTNPHLRCIFPAGLVLAQRDGKEVLHVSCGENDSAVKIITMDKELLLESLKTNKLPQFPPT